MSKKMTVYPRMIRVMESGDRAGVFFEFAAETTSDGQPDGEQIKVFVSDRAVDRLIETLKNHRAKRRLRNTSGTKH